ncbi:MAG: hypothetical protein RID81_06920 [Sandaracinaceae bacterium]
MIERERWTARWDRLQPGYPRGSGGGDPESDHTDDRFRVRGVHAAGPQAGAAAEALDAFSGDLFDGRGSGFGLLEGLDLLADAVKACRCSGGYALAFGPEAVDAYREIIRSEGLDELGVANGTHYLGIPLVEVANREHAGRGVLWDALEWSGAGARLL